MPKIPRDPTPEMVARLLINLTDTGAEGIMYDLIQPVPESDPEAAVRLEDEEV